MIVAILALIGIGIAIPVLRKAGVVPSASFAVDNAGSDESCSVLGDYCLRVQCAATNTGNAQGSVRIVAEIVPDSGAAVTHVTTRVLTPGEREVVALDFMEAEMGNHYKYRCTGEPAP